MGERFGENFLKLLSLMEYKSVKNNTKEGEFFTYKPRFIVNYKKDSAKISKNSAFDKLSELRLR